jgi:hypothetical protein
VPVLLDPEAFTRGCRMIERHMRTRSEVIWSPEDFKLKFVSFNSEFPEVNTSQFLWACERWIQETDDEFLRFPTWKQLMAPLYRCENGIPNRSWGPRPDLPRSVQFTAEQLNQLPQLPVLQPEALPPAQEDDPDDTTRLTDAKWQAYLQGAATGTDSPGSQLPWTKPFATRNVLETGLREGLWSTTQFNGPSPAPPVLPSLGFLEEHPQFRDRFFRDLAAYARRPQGPLF